MNAARPLLRDLRLRGVRVQTPGDRFLFEAPKGVLTPDVQEALRAVKAPALDALLEEERLLDLQLSAFARQHSMIEVKVPFLEGTLWFVPDVSYVEVLAREGVSRGRVWTARELLDLLNLSPEPAKDFQRLATLRSVFGAEIVYVGADLGEGTRRA